MKFDPPTLGWLIRTICKYRSKGIPSPEIRGAPVARILQEGAPRM